MFKPLDPLLNNELRLKIMSILLTFDNADFVYLKEQTQATSGNLSVQIDKLSNAEYIDVKKTFEDKRPKTICQITPKGMKAFDDYIEALKTYLP